MAPCIREFDIVAFSVPIVYNHYGDHDPNGMMYALKDDVNDIKADAEKNYHLVPPQPSPKVIPLVLRCHVGDIIRVKFHNALTDTRASIHIQGVNYNVLTSDGASVGYNPDTTTSDTIDYTWFADKEGIYLFSDLADPRSGEFTNIHGLFGALFVEAPCSQWFNPVDGTPLKSGLFADIYTPGKKSFREYGVFFQDELAVKDKNGHQPMDPHTMLPSSTMGISYRSEPMRNRMLPEHLRYTQDPHILEGEDVGMSSWTFNDPATFLLNAYVGDPCTMRLVHAGVKETHVMHVHNHQWRLESNNPDSTIIDSQSISPQECYNIEFLFGAGSLTRTIGDVIWHCHLYPHFMEGMWGLWRIFDRLQDGNNHLPNNVPIPSLMPLKDRPCPPKADPLHPGFPNFIEGESGERPLQPPLGILNPDGTVKTIPTQLEEANFVRGAVTGALYSRTCPISPPCKPDKVFEIALIQANVVYNHFGWHDPQGRFFVLKEEIEACGGVENYIHMVECGEIKVEPLVIRANAGDCIEVRLTNLLPLFLNESAFELKTLTNIVGYHIHLVKFDTITSDGSANGWCNIAGAFTFETLIERFYANEELRTVFFHDHLYPNSHQQHGVFGALLIEPKGSTFHDKCTGKRLRKGTEAVIRRKDGTSFREFMLMVHDFAYLFDDCDQPLNPPDVPGSHDDPGVMAINYRCEPIRERLCAPDADPAYIFSSDGHGDPSTPILETYAGDEIVIRLLQGAQEEQHCFNIVGMQWRKEPNNLSSPPTTSQTLGISEAFNFHINKEYGPGDYLYYFGGIDDVWLGAWGIIRAYKEPNSKLKPIRSNADNLRPIVKPPRKAIVRHYQIAAMKANIEYNRYGDHDPDGLIFVPLSDYKNILEKKKVPTPLILRANKGDIIRVTLHNKLSPDDPVQYFDYPVVPLDMKHKPSNRVSITPQFLQYNNLLYSGVNVGCNEEDQTVGPGDSKTYEWYADYDYGTCSLNSFGDLRNHRYHGLFGAIIIEPKGSLWYSLEHYKNATYEDHVIIAPPDEEPFRENVVFIQNGIRLLDSQGNLIKTAVDPNPDPDPEPHPGPHLEPGSDPHPDHDAHPHQEELDSPDLLADTSETPDIVLDSESMTGSDSITDSILMVDLDTITDSVIITDSTTITDSDTIADLDSMPDSNQNHCHMPEPNPQNPHGIDPEDTGEKGYNYRSERFYNRIEKANKPPHLVFSSNEHSDPSTPVFHANTGDRVIFRTLMPSDKPRNVSFAIHGHMWREFPKDKKSRIVPVQGHISVNNVYDAELIDGASLPGDYLYRSGSLRWDVESGMWGIFRVHDRPVNCSKKHNRHKFICRARNWFQKHFT